MQTLALLPHVMPPRREPSFIDILTKKPNQQELEAKKIYNLSALLRRQLSQIPETEE